MKKQLILALAMSVVSATAFAAPDTSATPQPPEATSGAMGSTNHSGTDESSGSVGAATSGASGASNSTYGTTGATGSTSNRTTGEVGGSGSPSMGDTEMFSKLDKNSDGQISKGEAKKDKALSKQFDQADTDRDGKLSQTEYQAVAPGPSGSGPTGSAGGIESTP